MDILSSRYGSNGNKTADRPFSRPTDLPGASISSLPSILLLVIPLLCTLYVSIPHRCAFAVVDAPFAAGPSTVPYRRRGKDCFQRNTIRSEFWQALYLDLPPTYQESVVVRLRHYRWPTRSSNLEHPLPSPPCAVRQSIRATPRTNYNDFTVHDVVGRSNDVIVRLSRDGEASGQFVDRNGKTKQSSVVWIGRISAMFLPLVVG